MIVRLWHGRNPINADGAEGKCFEAHCAPPLLSCGQGCRPQLWTRAQAANQKTSKQSTTVDYRSTRRTIRALRHISHFDLDPTRAK